MRADLRACWLLDSRRDVSSGCLLLSEAATMCPTTGRCVQMLPFSILKAMRYCIALAALPLLLQALASVLQAASFDWN